jgi:thymidylate synthase
MTAFFKPYALRAPNNQYAGLVSRVLTSGEWAATRQGPPALTLLQQTMAFDLDDGFPLIPDRSLAAFWRKPIGELCAFINGATTLDELAEFGCDWWGPWATPEKTEPKGLSPGDLGPGSYGGAFRRFPTAEGTPFDQFTNLVAQLRDLPDARTHVVTPWIPQYQARGDGRVPWSTIAPCHGWVHVRVLSCRLHLHMFQRSGDVPVGVPSNMIQYAALLLMLEHLTCIRAGVFHHTISDAHIYEDQVDAMNALVRRDPRRLPTVQLTDKGRQVTTIHGFRAEHFQLSDYDPHPAMTGIPAAV